MADKKSFSQSRNLLISDADMIAEQARHYLSRAEAYDPPHWFHRRAADTFYEAATRYQEAGLGLMAKVLYGYAKDCYGRNGQPEESARCEALVNSVPVLWGEVRP